MGMILLFFMIWTSSDFGILHKNVTQQPFWAGNIIDSLASVLFSNCPIGLFRLNALKKKNIICFIIEN